LGWRKGCFGDEREGGSLLEGAASFESKSLELETSRYLRGGK
jgi:hypothetical protein